MENHIHSYYVNEIFDNKIIRRARSVGAATVCMFGVLVLLGYSLNYKAAWAPIPLQPPTHPVSALCLALLGFGFTAHLSARPGCRIAARAAVIAVAALLTLRLLMPWMSASLYEATTPFGGIIAAQGVAGHPITLGSNTVYALLAIAVAEILRWKGWSSASQLLAFGAVALLLVAFVGCLYNLVEFRGRMSPVTIAGGLFLALAEMSASYRSGFIRPIVAGTEPGRLARLLLCWSLPVILLIGRITSDFARHSGMDKDAGVFLAYQTALIVMLSWVLVIIATGAADLIDRGRHAAETSLQRATTTDSLTGLLNRTNLERQRSTGVTGLGTKKTAELFIDLDRFQKVNDTFGTVVADEFLVEVGRRLVAVGSPHPIGRIGGDEFAIYCVGIELEEAAQIANRVTAALAVPFTLGDATFHLTASVGVAHSDTAGDTHLLAAAHSATDIAKRRGGNQVALFQGRMYEDHRKQVEVEQYLYAALERDTELSLAYQPIISLTDGSLVAVEALARWNHPRLGLISPDRFIGVAEATGLIVPLGRKLMEIAVAQAAKWKRQYPSCAPKINLNISPLQFANGNVIAELKYMMDRQGLPTTAICIEVTEGAFSDNQAVTGLQGARDAGFIVAMDDFGVGYSSLGQLPRLPVTTVKLDRSFIVQSTETEGGASLLASIVQLVHGLKMRVVAEGVETPEQLALVTNVGCDAVQGYIYARPFKAEDFEAWFSGRAMKCEQVA